MNAVPPAVTLTGVRTLSASQIHATTKKCFRGRLDVKSTGGLRALAVHAREQEILARTDFHYSCARWCFAGSGKEFGDCAIYLHTILVMVSSRRG